MSWWYEDVQGRSHGPVADAELVHLFKSGSIDGLTKVKRGGASQWQVIGEVTDLRQLLASIDDEDDYDDEADDVDDGHVKAGQQPSDQQGAAAATAGHGASHAPPKMWFYAEVGGNQSGPAPTEAFGSLVAAGYVTPATLVWSAGMTEWKPLGNVPELQAQLGQSSSASHGAASASTGASAGTKRPRDAAAGPGADAGQAGAGAAGDGSGAGTDKQGRQRKRSRKGPSGPNTWVYVTGLPPDVSEDELESHFKLAGMVKVDPDTGGPKIKVYRQADGAGPGAQHAGAADHDALPPCKGDASVCYVMPESVELAIELLDGVPLREPRDSKQHTAAAEGQEGQQTNASGAGASSSASAADVSSGAAAGWPLHVEAASFDNSSSSKSNNNNHTNAKGQGHDGTDAGGAAAAKDGASRPKKQASQSGAGAGGAAGAGASKTLTAAQRQARIRQMEQAVKLSWADEGDEAAPVASSTLIGGSKGVSAHDLRIVVLKHMFEPSEAASHPGGPDSFAQELRDDVGEEVETQCGDIEKMTVFTRHPDGVILIKFVTPGAAARCLTGMHGRYFGGRKIEVSFWDGVTDYSHSEGTDEEQERIDDFGKWLEDGEDS